MSNQQQYNPNDENYYEANNPSYNTYNNNDGNSNAGANNQNQKDSNYNQYAGLNYQNTQYQTDLNYQTQSNPYQNQPPVNNMPAYNNGMNNVDAIDYMLSQPAYGCGFGEAIRRFFVKYFDAKGRASRSEYWWIALFNSLIFICLSITGRMVDGNIFNMIYGLYSLFIIIPTFTLYIRRLHDIGVSGWWALIFILASIVGIIMLIIGFIGIIGILLNAPTSASSAPMIGVIGALLMLASGITSFVFTVMGPKTDGSNLKWDKYYQYYNM